MTLTTKILGAIALVMAAQQVSGDELRYSVVNGYGELPLAVVEAGERGQPGIMLIHGFAQSYIAFSRQLRSDLAGKFHIVAFDMRGHGASPKPWLASDYADSKIWADDVEAVMTATGLEKPVLVGWSYGGYVVSDFVRHYGVDRISGVALVGSLGGLVPASPSDMTDTLREIIANSERSRSLVLDDNLLAARATGELLSTSNMTPDERSNAFAMQVMMPAYVRRLMRSRDLDNIGLAPAFDVPVILIRGTEDMVMPADGTSALDKLLPSSELEIFDGAGHLPFVEEPERFNRIIAEFAVRAASARASH